MRRGIAYWLLPGFDDYRAGEMQSRVLKVIAKVPKADPRRFEAVLRGAGERGEWQTDLADDFCKVIFSGLDGLPAARDLPGVLLSIGLDYVLNSESGRRRSPYAGLDRC